MTGRVAAALGAGLREYRRTPLLLALIVVMPAYAILVFTTVAPGGTARLHLAGDVTATADLPAAVAVLMTPTVAALLGGIAGLFLMHTAREADRRLVVAGYRSREVILARFGLLALVGVVVTAVSVGVALTSVAPESLAWFAAGTLLTALVYGAVGVLAGVLVSKLAGVYLLLFGSMIDLFLFGNPLATEVPGYATALPGQFPLAVATRGAFTGGVDADLVGGSLAALGLLYAAATLAFYRSMRS